MKEYPVDGCSKLLHCKILPYYTAWQTRIQNCWIQRYLRFLKVLTTEFNPAKFSVTKNRVSYLKRIFHPFLRRCAILGVNSFLTYAPRRDEASRTAHPNECSVNSNCTQNPNGGVVAAFVRRKLRYCVQFHEKTYYNRQVLSSVSECYILQIMRQDDSE
jgi:hypothetical protein